MVQRNIATKEIPMKVLNILAPVLTSVILIPSGAHLFELPGKIGLDRDAYFIVQAIYAGWAFFAIPILVAILANGAIFVTQRRHHPGAARWALLSTALIVGSLVIFFTWVYPANQATSSWTVKPASWEMLRRHWEYGHAVNAVVVFCALLATIMATVRR
jgi:hypothetical protein